MIQYIYGYFKNYDNTKTYTVEIGDNTVSDPSDMLEIGVDNSTEYITDADSLFFSPDPVHISMDFENTFDHVVTRSCSIQLITNMDMTTILTSFFSDDIPVTVSLESTILFSGYVEPLTFNQGYDKHWNEYTIQCKDKLAISEYIKYPSVVPSSTTRTTLYTFSSIIEYIKQGVHLTNVMYDTKINTLQGYMNATKISQYSFYGDTQEDYLTCKEVLEAIGKYWSVWFMQIGNNIKVFDWHDISTSDISIQNSDYVSNDTNISISDAYNQIVLNCNIAEMDSLIEDPFSDDYLYSTYPQFERYMTEHVWEGEGKSAIESMSNVVQGYTTQYDGYYTVDNYAWIMKNDLWSFPLRDNNSSNYLTQSSQIQSLRWLKENPINAGFIAWGKADKPDASDNSLVNKMNLDNTLTISICGHSDHRAAAVGGHISTMLTNISTNAPIMSYIPVQEYVLTPTDSDTTNYIIFSGDILLNRLQPKTAETKYDDNVNLSTWATSEVMWDDLTLGCATPITKYAGGTAYTVSGYNRYWHHTIPIEDQDSYYTQSYAKDNVEDVEEILMHGNMGYDKLKLYKYEYNADGSGHDNLTKLPILCCELKVGDKYCCERVDLGVNGQNKFEWLTLEEWEALGIDATGPFFTLGINPKIGQHIIGEKIEISNNIDYAMNIDAKGTAIPITYDDNLAGQLSFKILGPYNLIYNNVTHTTEHKWLFFGTKDIYTSNDRFILEDLENILIYSFKCEIKSDNAGIMNNRQNTDLAYCSQINTIFQTQKSEDTDIVTSLTAQEIADDNLDIAPYSYSYVVDSSNKLWKGIGSELTGYTKPEERYTYWYYNEYYRPASIVETTVKIANLNYITNPFMYRFKYTFKPARSYALISYDAGLKYDTFKMSAKEDLWS